MTRLLFAALALLSATACLPPVDFASNVHDLRVLAVQTNPPEILVPINPKTQQLDPRLALALPDSLKIRALVADPAGAGRPVHYVITMCARAVNLNCEGQDGALTLAEGDFKYGETHEITAELPILTKTGVNQQAIDFLLDALKQDPLKGIGGLPVPISVHLTAGNEEIVGGKRMVFSLPVLPNQKANVLPPPPDVLVDGLLLVPNDAPVVSQLKDSVFETFPVEETVPEQYTVVTFDGGTRTLTENWQYSWFATKGHFSPEKTGGFEPNTGQPQPTETSLQFNDDEQPGELTVWCVLRDGRGGEVWVERKATYLGHGVMSGTK